MSQVLFDFRESVEDEEWPDALFGLNSLDMKEMLLGLASVPDSLLDEKGPLLNQPNQFQRTEIDCQLDKKRKDRQQIDHGVRGQRATLGL